MGLRRRLERLEASAPPLLVPDEDSEARQAVEDYLTELAIYRGELDESEVPGLEESRRRADEAFTELQDEWRRLEERRGSLWRA